MSRACTNRIPTKIRLPFSYNITVKQVSTEEMIDLQISDADGAWFCDTHTIYIRKSLPIKRRRYILAHELGHAWLDWQHCNMDAGAAQT